MKKEAPTYCSITWDPQKGLLHFESNLRHVELLGILELVKSVLTKQMAAGMGTGVLAEGRLRQPALQVRRVDSDN